MLSFPHDVCCIVLCEHPQAVRKGSSLLSQSPESSIKRLALSHCSRHSSIAFRPVNSSTSFFNFFSTVFFPSPFSFRMLVLLVQCYRFQPWRGLCLLPVPDWSSSGSHALGPFLKDSPLFEFFPSDFVKLSSLTTRGWLCLPSLRQSGQVVPFRMSMLLVHCFHESPTQGGLCFHPTKNGTANAQPSLKASNGPLTVLLLGRNFVTSHRIRYVQHLAKKTRTQTILNPTGC